MVVVVVKVDRGSKKGRGDVLIHRSLILKNSPKSLLWILKLRPIFTDQLNELMLHYWDTLWKLAFSI